MAIDVEFDCRRGIPILLLIAFLSFLGVVQGRDIDVNVDHLRTNLILYALDGDIVIMRDKKFSWDVEYENFIDFTVRSQLVQQFANVGCAGQYFLDHITKCFEDWRVEDGSEV